MPKLGHYKGRKEERMNTLKVGEMYKIRGSPVIFRDLGKYLGETEGTGYFELADGNFAIANPAENLRELGGLVVLSLVSSGVFSRTRDPSELSEDKRKNLELLMKNLQREMVVKS